MIVYVLFALVTSNGTVSFTYEFKDNIQCQNTLSNIKAKFQWTNVHGFCQQVIK